MKRFQLANNIIGGIIFAIAAVVYLMTIEPTASLWDCGEFITSASKLEVGHPPGAPLFMLIGNLFTNMTDASNAAKMVNAMSALFSALTILFLFWTITHLSRRLLVKAKEDITLAKTILILGCGVVGSLAYAFSDTFWFSAVEGEVYAFSSLFTAVVFWLILKWEEHADAPHADRWIILIAYLMGLSIGVHLLNLLCIPAIALVYYYKKSPNPTVKGAVYALVVSFLMIAIMMYGIIQGIVEVCGWFELFFVNKLGMSYNTGTFVYIIAIAGTLAWSIWETTRPKINAKRMKIAFVAAIALTGCPFIGNGYMLGLLIIAGLLIFLFKYKRVNAKALNTILLSLTVIVIGYSSFALILIRATADTPMNQNRPQDIFALRSYLAREQYGETPLLYGRTYVSEVKRVVSGNICTPITNSTSVLTRVIKDKPDDKDFYINYVPQDKYEYVDETCMLFPRMHSSEQSHVAAYKDWGQVKGTPVKINQCGETKTVMKPTFVENIRFFFNYQLNFMYWRYFMWNFSGRQNDLQGYGDIMRGNWITGIKFIDEALVGPQDNMPDDIAKNKAHNVFYMLPLLLGIIGILYQVLKKENVGIQSFWITFFLFFMTGIAIVLYLNQPPLQPRERDYAYAGSFYAFCIWIGIGVAGVAKLLERYAKLPSTTTAILASALCLLVPLQMVSQTWDDHDRSGRYIARDFGRNYLESCEPNAVIFTYGDNDTFPLWYVQEVEGVRTDVRICNTSYLQTDWYINQMKREAYNSEPLPISWTYKDYVQSKRDHIYIIPKPDIPALKLGAALEFARSDDPKHRMPYGKEMIDYLPSEHLYLDVDSAEVVKTRTVSPEYAPYITNRIDIELTGKTAITKVDAIMLDMINTNKWRRPVYYATTVPPSMYAYMKDYLQKTGLAYQVVPVKTSNTVMNVNTRQMFDNVMHKFRWGGVDKSNVYLDESAMRMCKAQRSMLFCDLARSLFNEGKRDSAVQVLDRCIEVFPEENVPYDISIYPVAELYFSVGENDKALFLSKKLITYLLKSIDWMMRLKPDQRAQLMDEVNYEVSIARNLLLMCHQYDKESVTPYIDQLDGYIRMLQPADGRRAPQQPIEPTQQIAIPPSE